MIAIVERYVATSGGETYCRLVSPQHAAHPPLIVIHGGPGLTWDYLQALDQLAAAGQPVYYYDQLGNGRSAMPNGGTPAISLVLMVQQLREVVAALVGDGRYVLMGHSSGSALAIEHALEQPPGLAGLVIANGCASARDMADSIWRRRRDLPADTQAILDEAEAQGTTASPAYAAAFGVFFQRHVCRLSPMPAGLQHSLAALGQNPAVFGRLWGPDIFQLSGALAGWSATSRLGAITVPSLVYRGEYDEADAQCMQPLLSGLAGASSHVFLDSSHMPHAESPQQFCDRIAAFLTPLLG